MRIAVCLSGMLRSWELAHKNQLWFWSTSGAEVDYFIHTWDYSADRTGVSKPYVDGKVTEEEFNKICNIYDVKKSIYSRKKQEEFVDNDHWLSLFYSLSQSLMLKREYEIEHNFQYDVVIKSRPDVVFNPNITFAWPRLWNNTVFTTHGGPMSMEFNMYNFNDCVFLGNSYTMDLLVNLYFYRKDKIREDKVGIRNFHPLGPGTLMHDFYREYGITPFFNLPFKETLIKLGCPQDLDLVNPDEFPEMNTYFREWYTK